MSGNSKRAAFNRSARQGYLSSLKKKLAASTLAIAMVMPTFAQAQQAPPAPPSQPATLELQDSTTTYSKRIADLQREFNTAAKDVDIVVIDRDWFQLNRALNQDAVKDDEQLKALLLSKFIEQTVSQRFSPQNLRPIAGGVLNGSGVAYNVPYKVSFGGLVVQERRLCVVFGQRAAMGGPEQTANLLGAHPLVHGQDVAGARLTKSLPVDVQNRLTDYHEIGHCMDKWYLTEAQKTDFMADSTKYLLQRHQAEMFAEIFSLLMLARDGDQNMEEVANWRANIRLAGMAFSGPLITKFTPQDNPMRSGSYIYAIHEGIWGARDTIKQLGTAGLRNMSMDEIRELAHKLTDTHSLKMDGAEHAVTFMMEREFDLSIWERLRTQFPHIEDRYQIATKVKAQINEALRQVFDLRHLPQGTEPLDAIKFDISGLRALQQMQGPNQSLVLKIMSEQIVSRAGGKDAATNDTLEDAFSAMKDELRLQLLSNNGAERLDALRKLQLMPEAMKQAARTVKGEPAVEPAQDTPGQIGESKTNDDVHGQEDHGRVKKDDLLRHIPGFPPHNH